MATDAIGAGAGIPRPSRVADGLPLQKGSAPRPRATVSGDTTSTKAIKETAKPTGAALQKAVDTVNQVLEVKTSNEMQFSIVKGAGIAVVKMVDQQTGKTIMQFPSEAMIEIAKTIDQVTGAIIKTQA